MTGVTSAPAILVVDDDQTIRLGFSAALRSVGFDVAVAASGEEAVACAGRWRPGCILLDFRMPGMDGLQAAARIREAGYRGPMVLASACADHRAAVEALRAGIADFLAKPVKPAQLRFAVQDSLGRHAQFSADADASADTLSSDLLRAYGKYCISQLRHAEALAALRRSARECPDLQSLLLVGALLEMNGNLEAAGIYFALAAKLHVAKFTAPSELFRVFSHADPPVD